LDQIDLSVRLEHVFDIRINFDRRWSTEPIHRDGPRFAYTSVGAGGVVSGPRLQGQLVDHSGADWPMIRTDGVVELNAHYMIRATGCRASWSITAEPTGR